MAEEKKDFKEVKVKIQGGQKGDVETLSRSMLYSGVNIFGELTRLYLESKDNFQAVAMKQTGVGGRASSNQSASNMQDTNYEGGMTNLDHDVLQIFKRLQKRDSITKVKAFQELETYLDGLEKGSDELGNLLTFFLYHMCRILMNERDKKVREAAHSAFAAFIRKGKRKLAPHIKKIFPLWLCSFFDPAAEVSNLAKQNFDSAFPEAKQGGVFKLAYKNFLHFADEQLCQSEESFSEHQKQEKVASQESFDRITSSVLLALAHCFTFVDTWSIDERKQFQLKLVEVLDLKVIEDQEDMPEEEEEKLDGANTEESKQPETQMIDTSAAADQQKSKKRGRGRRGLAGQQAKVQKSQKASEKQNYMWAFLSNRYRGRVRAACLQFVAIFINKMPIETVKAQLSQFAPLVFNLVGEQNSLLQTSLWSNAMFGMGQKFPESWTFINIKKDFLPKLNKCLKEAGFGAPVPLYENFVKYVSINPLYKLESQPNTQRDGKLNKASFKDRCNLIREVMQNLYSGLKNDESVAYHVEAVASFFESMTFILLKRVQPMLTDSSVTKAEDKQFGLNEITKLVQLPINDFIESYAKFKSRIQNARNIRSSIPRFLVKMLTDLIGRDLDQSIFELLCDLIYECLKHTERNSGRIFSYILKQISKITKKSYKDTIIKNILVKLIVESVSELNAEIPETNKQTVQKVVKKCSLYRRLLYTLNKHEEEARELVQSTGSLKGLILQTGQLLVKMQTKEKLAFKMLSQDDLKHFMQIKTHLVDQTILMVNLGWTDAEPELELIMTQGIFVELQTNPVLQKSTDRLEEIVFRPHLSLVEAFDNVKDAKGKIDFELYFDAVRENESIHNVIFEAMSGKMLLKDQITHYAPMIAACIESQIQEKASPLSEEDVDILKNFLIIVLQGEDISMISHQVLHSYFQASKGLLIVDGDENNAEMRELLFEQLLSRRVGNLSEQESFNKIWDIFTQAVKDRPNFIEHCINRLGSAVRELIAADSNNLEGIASFQHLTSLIYRFIHLQSDKLDVLKRIILSEANFCNLDKNALPLKMFRDLFLDGNVNLDVGALIQERNETGGFKYAWLVATMLNFKYLVSLTSFLELKNQLLIFVESDVIPALIFGDKTLIVSLCELISHKALTNHSYKLTFEYLIAKLVDPGEDFDADVKPVLRVDEFSQIFECTGRATVELLLDSNFTSQEINEQAVEIIEKLLSYTSYYICDQPILHQLFNKVKTNLNEWLANNTNLESVSLCASQFLFYTSMANSFEQVTPSEITEFQIQLVNYLLTQQDHVEGQTFKQVLQKLAIQISGCFFTPENKVLIQEKLTMTEFMNTMVEMLMNISLQIDQQADGKHVLDCSTLIQLCSVIKKTLGQAGQLADTIVSVFIQAVKDRALWFDQRIQQQATSFTAGGLQQLEVEMLKEMGETLLVCISFLNEEVLKAHVEDNLYYILGCQIEALQKSAFVLLRYIYENFLPPVTINVSAEEELRQLQADFNEEVKEDEEREREDGDRGKSSIAFRNVSQNMIQIIDNAPNVIGHDNEVQDISAAFIPSNQLLEKLVFGESQEGCMNSKVFGYFLCWNAMLQKIEQGRIKSQLTQANQYQQVLASLTDYLEANSPIYEMLLVSLVPFLPIIKKGVVGRENYSRELSQFQPEYCSLNEEQQSRCLILHTLINFMKNFPSLARKFYDNCDKQILVITKPYIKSVVSPAIMENEIKKIELAQLELGQSSQLSFVLIKQTKEIVATYEKNAELSLRICLKIPSEYPLKSVEIDLNDQILRKSGHVRKWSLSIRNLIQSRNGDIISAILLWKSNIDQEMEGIEECHICYCVLHATDKSLPTLPCRNCQNKFHVGCIRKWFNTSNKSNCPLCQTFFWQ